MPASTCALKRPPRPAAREPRRGVITRTVSRAWRDARPRATRLSWLLPPLLAAAQWGIERGVVDSGAAARSADVLGLGLSGSLFFSGLLIVFGLQLLRSGPPARPPLRWLVVLPILAWGLFKVAGVASLILSA